MDVSNDDAIEYIKNTIETSNNNIDIYLIIFNILTENNTLKNYTNNSNGIFFNITNGSDNTNTNSISDTKIIDIYNKLKDYLNIITEQKHNDKNREELIERLKSTMDSSSYKTDLDNFINDKGNELLYTSIDVNKSILPKMKEEVKVTNKNKSNIEGNIKLEQKVKVFSAQQQRIIQRMNGSMISYSSKINTIKNQTTDNKKTKYNIQNEENKDINEDIDNSLFGSDEEDEECDNESDNESDEECDNESYNESDNESYNESNNESDNESDKKLNKYIKNAVQKISDKKN